MYGFWRLGLRPAPSSGAACGRTGSTTKTSRKAKNVATPPSTGTVHGSSRRISSRLSVTASEPSPVSTNSQSSSEPSWPPQKPVSEYGNGSLREEWSATYVKVKSRAWKAWRSTNAATAVAMKAPTRALRADS